MSGRASSRSKARQDWVSSASFSADGTHVVTGSHDKTARVWRVFPDLNKLIFEVRRHLSRCLSQTQRDGYGLPIEHLAKDLNFIPSPTPDGRCPG